MRRFTKGLALAGGGALVLGLAAWLAAGLAKTPLDAAERARAQAQGAAHAFASLADGVTHYRLAGPVEGPVVVLVHGFSNGSYVWDEIVPPLAAAGQRVLALDLYGRGFSDRPSLDYGADLYDRQLTGLLAGLGLHAPLHLVGYSMGGAVVAGFVARHPERVRSAVFIAPAGLSGELPSAWLAAPLLGDWIFRVLGPSLLARIAERELLEARDGARLVAAYRRQAAYAGYEQALLSTARHFPLTGATAAWDAVGRSGRPVLAFWGTRDEIVPFERSQELLRRVPQARLRALEGMTHAVTYAHPEAILPELIRFLASAP